MTEAFARAMPQPLYDRPDFFTAYAGLRRSREGLDGAPEWPSLRRMLPALGGLRVVDLGCGFGWFCRWAAEQGAARVLGLDISARMLERAAAMTADPRITYERADLEQLALPAVGFDLAYSALALHYLADAGRFFAAVRRALGPGGHFVFSTEHPIYTAPARPGWSVDAEGRKTWPIDGYAQEGPRRTDWLAPGVVKHHRMLGTTLTQLIGAGLAITAVEEFHPSAEQVAAMPALAEESERPMFLLVAARRGTAPG